MLFEYCKFSCHIWHKSDGISNIYQQTNWSVNKQLLNMCFVQEYMLNPEGVTLPNLSKQILDRIFPFGNHEVEEMTKI